MDPTLEMIEPWLHSAPAAAVVYFLLSSQIRRLENTLDALATQVSDLRRRVSRLEMERGIEDTAQHIIPVSASLDEEKQPNA